MATVSHPHTPGEFGRDIPAAATILVVEDEVIVAEDIRRRLLALGYAVGGVVHSGEAAITRARAVRPDLILMDIRIAGGMDGIQTAEAILREMDVPVVFATAYSDDATLERAKQVTPYGYVLKPFEERELRTTVEMALFNHVAGSRVRSSERRYRALIEEAADAILLIDRSGSIRELNRMALRLLGCSRQEVLERPVSQILTAGDAPAFPLPTEPGASIRTEGSLRRPDGQTVPVDVHARLLDTETIEAILRDISEQRRVEQTLLRRIEKERFVADFSSRLITLAPDEVDRELPIFLESIGQFTGADRAMLCFLKTPAGPVLEFHEWGTDGRTILGPALNEHFGTIAWSTARLSAGETVCLYQVDDLPREAAAEGQFWKGIGVRSLVIVPIRVNRQLHGLVACTAEDQGRLWNSEDIRLLRVLGDILGNAIDRLHVLTELQRSDDLHRQAGEEAVSALRLTEDRFRTLVENISDVVFSVDMKGFLTYVSPSVKAVSGWSPADLVGQNLFRFIHPHDRETLRDEWQKVFRGQVGEFEFRLLTRDGDIRFVRVSARRLEEANEGVIGILVDMTRRHETEERLRESEQEYRRLWEDSSDGLVLIDRETGEILDANREFCRLAGRSRELLRTMRIWEIRPAEQQAQARQKFLEFSRTGEGSARNLDFERPSGERVLIEFHTRVTRRAGREVLQSCCIERAADR